MIDNYYVGSIICYLRVVICLLGNMILSLLAVLI